MTKSIIRTAMAVAVTIIGTVSLSAQETEGNRYIFDDFKEAFTQEGVKAWKPEISVRQVVSLSYSPQMVTLGARISPKWVLGAGAGHAEFRGRHSLPFYGYGRRYFSIGTKNRFYIYSDLFLGYNYRFCYQKEVYSQEEPYVTIVEQKDKGTFFWSWQPGIALRLWGKSNLFLGFSLIGTFEYPVPAPGLHLGLAF